MTGVLLLTAGDRPTSCGGCTSDRLISFRRNQDVDHTFHFFEHVSQGVTGIPQLLDAFNRGDPIAITQLDSNSEGMIFEGDSTINAGGLHPPTIFDSLYEPTTRWGHLPYTFADNGPAQVVTLPPTWTTQIRTVRNYDHGLCFARVSYDSLMQQVHAQLAGRFGGYCLGDHSEFFRLGTEVGPLFRSAIPAITRSITGTSTQDQLIWDIQLDGRLETGAGMDCTIVVHPELDTRLIHGFSVVQFPGGPLGAMRITLSDFALQTGNDIKSSGTKRPPGLVENNINGQLQSDFPDQFRGYVNSSFAIPSPSLALIGIWQQGKLVTSLDQLPLCNRDSDCPVRDGPEDGCFHPFMTGDFQLSPLLVSYVVNAQAAVLGQGVCVQRFEPKRVNLTPTGIEIVLTEDDRDPTIRLAQLFATQMNGSFQCSVPPKTSTNPTTIDVSALLQMSRIVKFYQ